MNFPKRLFIAFLASTIGSVSGVFAAGIDHFEVKLSPESAKVGESLDLTIEAVDKNNETILDYDGTILIFSESDPEAELPSALEDNTYSFSASDQGLIKFENSVIFKSSGLQDIHIYDLNDDTVFGVAEADISEDAVIKNLDITIASPEDGLTIGENSISISGLTQKNYQIKIIVNGSEEFTTASNNEGIFEKTVEDLADGENTFKAQVLDADGNVIGESKEIKIKVALDNLSIKDVKVTPESVDPEDSYEVELVANSGLSEVSIIVNDTLAVLKETTSGVYTTKIYAPKEAGTYKIDAKVKDELGHEKTEIGAASIKVNEPELTVAEEVKEETSTGELNSAGTEKRDLKITGLKLVELKTKSILTWDKIEDVEGYNVYKKLENGEFELIQKVEEPKFEVEITGDEIKYDYFAVKAEAKTLSGELYEGALSDATKVKTGPELLILLILSLFIGGFLIISKQKNA